MPISTFDSLSAALDSKEQSWENLSFIQIISTEDKIGYILSRHPFPV